MESAVTAPGVPACRVSRASMTTASCMRRSSARADAASASFLHFSAALPASSALRSASSALRRCMASAAWACACSQVARLAGQAVWLPGCLAGTIFPNCFVHQCDSSRHSAAQSPTPMLEIILQHYHPCRRVVHLPISSIRQSEGHNLIKKVLPRSP